MGHARSRSRDGDTGTRPRDDRKARRRCVAEGRDIPGPGRHHRTSVIALLALIACALVVYLLAHPRTASGVKVVLLTTPPVAGVIWLLEEVYRRTFTAVAVAAVF